MRKNLLSALLLLCPAALFAAQPCPPSNVTATTDDTGVKITWTAPSEDVEETPINPDEIVYDVYRFVVDGESLLVGEDIADTKFTDTLEGISGDVVLKWQIIAKTDQGESSSEEGWSTELPFGNGAPIPYTETFNTPDTWGFQSDNYWLSESIEGWNDFAVETELYTEINGDYDYVYGKDYTEETADGFLCFEHSSWSACEVQYTSGAINLLSAVEPVLTFDYCVFPGAHTTFEVIILDEAGNATTLEKITPRADEQAWIDKSFNLKDFVGNKIRLRFHTAYDPDKAPAEGSKAPICIDNISMVETGDTAVEAIATESAVEETSYYNLQGMCITEPAQGELVVRMQRTADGKRRAEKIIF